MLNLITIFFSFTTLCNKKAITKILTNFNWYRYYINFTLTDQINKTNTNKKNTRTPLTDKNSESKPIKN